MADTKISAMTNAATLTGTEIVPLVQSGANVQTTVTNVVGQTLNVHPVTPTQGGTNITTYALGDTLYASATNTLAKLSGNTAATQKFLTQTGTGSASAAPIWKVLIPSDINTQYGAFHFDYSTTLASAINNTETTIPVVSTFGFSTTGAVIIGTELITYTGITSTSFTGCTRGVNNSNNVAHALGVYVNGAQVAALNTPTKLQINTIDISNGVTVNTTTSELTVAVAGTYNIQYSVQFLNTDNGQDLTGVWYVLDGVDVPSSASWASVPARASVGNPGAYIMTVNLFLTLNTANKLTLKWLTTLGHTSVVTYSPSASPSYPSAPAVIVTVNQVS